MAEIPEIKKVSVTGLEHTSVHPFVDRKAEEANRRIIQLAMIGCGNMGGGM